MLLDEKASALALHISIAERNCADWTASGRWASAAFQAANSDRQRLVAAIYEAEAAIITEETGLVDLALAHIKSLQPVMERDGYGYNGNFRWTLRRLRAVRACIGLLAIDSRLDEGIATAETALSDAGSVEGGINTSINAYLAQIRADMLALMIRSLDFKKGQQVAADLENNLSGLLPKSTTSNLAGRTIICCLRTLYQFYLCSGKTARCEDINRMAKEIKAQTRDAETKYGCTTVMAIHASYVEPAAVASNLFEELLHRDKLKGRIDRKIENSIRHDYLRLQFNAGQRNQAQLTLSDLLHEVGKRRSRYYLCLLKMEQEYQNRFLCRFDSSLYRDIRSLLPEEERLTSLGFKVDCEWRQDEPDEEQRKTKISNLNDLADLAREYGSCWIEGKACNSALELLSGGWNEELFSSERISRAEYLAEIFKDNLLGSNIAGCLATNVLTSCNAPAEPTSFSKALDLLDYSRRTREHLNIPDNAILSWLYISQVWASGSIYASDNSHGAEVLPLSMDNALQAVNEGIAFVERHPTNLYGSKLYCQRADLFRRLANFDSAREDGAKALDLARKDTGTPQMIEALNTLARIERDNANWSSACDWLEIGLKELIALGPFRSAYGYLDGVVLLDLIDGRPIPKSDEYKASKLRQSFIENIPRAARIFRDFLTLTRAYTGSDAYPFNDFWYYGDEVRKANLPEAVWFLGAAIYRDKIERSNAKPDPQRDSIITRIHGQIDKITGENGMRPDLEFNPDLSIQSLQRKYGIFPSELTDCTSRLYSSHPLAKQENDDTTSFLASIWCDNLDQVEQLLAAGLNCNLADDDGNFAITIAACLGRHQIVQTLLSAGANINQSFKGWTPLHYACDIGNLETVKILLTHCARGLLLDPRDLAGWTPLMLAARKGYVSVIKLLIESGANCRLVNRAGLDALALAIQSGILFSVREFVANKLRLPPEQDSSTASDDQSHPHEDLASPLLDNAAIALTNYPNSDHLSLAVAVGNIEIVRTLIEAGANPNQPDNLGDTALHHAVRLGHMNVAKLLVQQGVPLDARDREGRTPIDIANENGNEEIIEFLISKGCKMPPIYSHPRLSDEALFLKFEQVSKLDEIWIRAQLIKNNLPISIDRAIFRIAHLPFYSDGVLIAIEDPKRRGLREVFALAKLGQEIFMMNWTNEPIYSSNEKWGIFLEDDELTLLYARFFFFFVRGQLGQFEIKERIEEIEWREDATEEFKRKVNDHLRALYVVDRSEPKMVRLRATAIFKNALFLTDILIAVQPCERQDEDSTMEKFTIGQVKLSDEQLLLEDLPVKVSGPPSVFG